MTAPLPQIRIVSRAPAQVNNQEGLSTDLVNGYMFAGVSVSLSSVPYNDALNCTSCLPVWP